LSPHGSRNTPFGLKYFHFENFSIIFEENLEKPVTPTKLLYLAVFHRIDVIEFQFIFLNPRQY
jgi:hypothetical protein